MYRLWDEIHAHPAAQSEEALCHALNTICGWIGARTAHWAALSVTPESLARSDELQRWRLAAYRSLRYTADCVPALTEEAGRPRISVVMGDGEEMRVLLSDAGRPRTLRLSDGLVDLESFAQTKHYKLHYEKLGIVDRLWSVCPVMPNAEAYFFFDLIDTDRRFTIEDTSIVTTALRGLQTLHLRLFLNYGVIIAPKPLTRMQRAIVQQLLTDQTEREIAATLGQSHATTHKHVETVYRAFGVKSRAALMALWLGGN